MADSPGGFAGIVEFAIAAYALVKAQHREALPPRIV
jgi:hypothetical protein